MPPRKPDDDEDLDKYTDVDIEDDVSDEEEVSDDNIDAEKYDTSEED